MPDVRLPSGKVIKNVPQGMSKEELMRRGMQNGLSLSDFQPRVDIKGKTKEAIKKFADDLSGWDKAKIGYMETLGTAGGRVSGLIGKAIPGEDRFDKFSEQMQRNRELTSNVEGGAALAGRVAPSLIAGAPVGAGLAGQAAFGAASGALTADNPAFGAVTGGLGAGVGNVAARTLGRNANAIGGKWANRAVNVADEEGEAVSRLARMGFKMTPGRASGKAGTQLADEVAESSVIFGSAHRSIEQHNSNLLTRYASKALGQKTDDIGPRALREIDTVIDDTFNTVADQVDNVPIGDDLAERAQQIFTKRALKDMKIDPDEMLNLTGRQYMKLRSKLLKITRGTGVDENKAWDLIDDMDDVVDDVAPSGYREAYAKAREKFKVLLSLEKTQSAVSSGGKVNARAVDKNVQKIFGKMYTRDKSALLPETDDFLAAVRGMATDRMRGVAPNTQKVASNLSTIGTLGLLGGGLGLGGLGLPGLVTAAGAGGLGWQAGRALMAAPAAAGYGMVGGGLGRIAPQAFDELGR